MNVRPLARQLRRFGARIPGDAEVVRGRSVLGQRGVRDGRRSVPFADLHHVVCCEPRGERRSVVIIAEMRE